MNAEEILTRTFAEHEGEAPDPHTVLAGVHGRLARRRRTVPALAAAATVAAIAIGATVLVDQQRPAPPPPATGVTPTPTPTGSNRTTPPDPTAEPDPLVRIPLAEVALSAVTLDTTWLPPGTAKTTELQLFYGSQKRAYNVTDSAGRTTRINFNVRSGSALTPDDAFVDAPAQNLTLGGRPAREWQTDSIYLVVVRLPGNRVAEVDVMPMSGGTVDLAATGRRVATSLRFGRPTPVRPEFRPTYVPKGLAVRAIGRSDGDAGAFWTLAAPTAPPEAPWVSLGLDTRPGTSATLPKPGVGARLVQGHPTVVTQDGDQVTLHVDRFAGRKSLRITVTGKLVPVAELYKIADGVRLID